MNHKEIEVTFTDSYKIIVYCCNEKEAEILAQAERIKNARGIGEVSCFKRLEE
jgi:hypothetical protein